MIHPQVRQSVYCSQSILIQPTQVQSLFPTLQPSTNLKAQRRPMMVPANAAALKSDVRSELGRQWRQVQAVTGWW